MWAPMTTVGRTNNETPVKKPGKDVQHQAVDLAVLRARLAREMHLLRPRGTCNRQAGVDAAQPFVGAFPDGNNREWWSWSRPMHHFRKL